MKKFFYTLPIIFLLSGCMGEKHADIKEWMNKQELLLKGKIEKIPPIKTFKPTQYTVEKDPFFRGEQGLATNMIKNKYAPNQNRVREELEYFDISTLKMIGSLYKDGIFNAMIKDSQNNIYYVKKGNYMGKNNGKIIFISEGVIILDERYRDFDEWTKKETRIELSPR